MPIRLLSEQVSSMIAAGEVIERPASVVKELLENSLDAGATEMAIEIRGGGVEYIRVSDNGCGIPYDEVDLAFQRFATSKVAEARDLDAIVTLGFRGEALPSIASVAHVSMVTRCDGEDSGTRIDIAEGRIGRKEGQGASPGTVTTVQQLFRNIPARRKFLRSAATETSQIQSLVTRYAMAYPETRFRLSVNGSQSFASPGSGDLREAIAAVYSLNVAQAMMELSSSDDRDDGGLIVSGMISPPAIDRANRAYMSFFVNRRWVQNSTLRFAVEQAYHGFMAERRYPLVILSINVPYEEVDVNAHPAKTEVRFRRQDRIFSAIQHAVRHTLTQHTPVPEVRRAHTTQAAFLHASSRPSPAAFWPAEPFAPPSGTGDLGSGVGTPVPQSPIPITQPPVPKKALPVLRVLGQVQNTYIVAEGPEGMYLIDQHAAHERVMFEKVRADIASRTAQVQSLLEPATVELDPRQQEMLESQKELFEGLGLVVEPFGGNVYLLRGVPVILAEGDPAKALLDVLDMMADGGDFETWEERAAYSIACHSAIRAGKTLSHQEMTALTRQLEECQQPHTCPHGRPTIIHMSAGLLEREFGRRG
jgi:DNA mismatch repair protein MutL